METHQIIKLLKSRQISPTRQRVDIAELLLARPQHVCAEQVMEMLCASASAKASKATVYNTLKLFTQHGLLRELHVEAGKVYFDSNTSEHHHIYNVDSGELSDIEAETLHPSAVAALPKETRLVGVDVIYRVSTIQDSE